MSARPPSGDHFPELDGVRGVAILLVLLLHHLGGVRLGPLGTPFRAGWMGVDLFFVLSGLLITRILLRQRGRPGYFRSFYARRALRIWPLYTLVLAFALLGAWRIPGLSYEMPAPQSAAYALYVQNLVYPGSYGPWPLKVTWSLAIEEQFYVAWPLLVALLPERWLRRFLWGVVAAMPVVRWAALAAGASPLLVYMHTGCRLDGLAAGGLLALALAQPGPGPGRFLSRARWGALLVPAACALVWSPLMGGDALIQRPEAVAGAELLAAGGVYTLLSLGFGGVVAMVVGGGGVPAARALFSGRALRWLGTRSYGLYLYHGITIHLDQALLRPWLRDHLGGRMAANAAGLALAVGGLLALAELSFRFFEQPLLSLKSRFQPGPAAAESLRAGAGPAYDRAPS
ncbi:MAG TPA: acyltransferase [Myxococcales bacterium]|nr:acyltransferase [Myxococcales bacterium]